MHFGTLALGSSRTATSAPRSSPRCRCRTLIGQRVEPTLALTLCTLIVAVALAVPLGVIAAARAGSWIDRIVMALSVLGLLGAGVRDRLRADLAVRGRARVAAGAGLHAASARASWPFIRHMILPERRARPRLHGADRAHHARDHARRAGAGLRAHRARQGPGARHGAGPARAEERRGADRHHHRHRRRAADRRRGRHRDACSRFPASAA